jgi:hypothetical protein
MMYKERGLGEKKLKDGRGGGKSREHEGAIRGGGVIKGGRKGLIYNRR